MLTGERLRVGGAGPVVWRIGGDLDASAVPLFHGLAPVPRAGDAAVVLDVTGVQFIDSRGLAAVVAWIRRCHDAEVPVAVCCDRPFMRRLLHIAGIEAIAPLGTTIADAVERLGRDRSHDGARSAPAAC